MVEIAAFIAGVVTRLLLTYFAVLFAVSQVNLAVYTGWNTGDVLHIAFAVWLLGWAYRLIPSD